MPELGFIRLPYGNKVLSTAAIGKQSQVCYGSPRDTGVRLMTQFAVVRASLYWSGVNLDFGEIRSGAPYAKPLPGLNLELTILDNGLGTSSAFARMSCKL